MDGTDRDVMAGQQLRQGALIQHVAVTWGRVAIFSG
jgi:hypothetical protein